MNNALMELADRLDAEADQWDAWNEGDGEKCVTTPPLLREAATQLRTAASGVGEAPDIGRWAMAKGSDGQRWSVYMDRSDTGDWCKWSEVQQKWCLSQLPGAEARDAVSKLDYNILFNAIADATKTNPMNSGRCPSIDLSVARFKDSVDAALRAREAGS